jgi:long-subunit fatty acid transport protein
MNKQFFRLLFAGAMFAATGASANSLYSRLGVGLVHWRGGVKAGGMGNSYLAVTDGVSAYSINPALFASIQLTRLQTDFSFESARVKVAENSGRFRDANFNGVSLVLPVKKGYAVAFGLLPYSRVDFTLNQFGSNSSGGYEETYSGLGGLDEIFLAFAGHVGNSEKSSGLRYGIAADFYFGRIRRTWRVNFDNGSLAATEDQVGQYVRGAGFHAGLQWFDHNWQLGAAVRTPIDLDVETETEYIFGDRSNTVQSTARLPLWLGLGLGYRAGTKWQFAADYRMQRWSEISADKALGASLQDAREFGAGAEFTASRNPLDAYWKRMSFRAGVSLAQLPYEDPAGQGISEWLLTAGLGLPFRRGSSRLDMAFEFGKRGDLKTNPAEETVFRFSISVSGAERWFVRNRP